MALGPERLQFDASGAPWSVRYGDVYASRDGALGQARHVFLGGNDLPQRWRGRAQFVVLETGFGLGINFMATWQAWRNDVERPRCLHYVALELHPVAAADLLAAAPPELQPFAAALSTRWPLPLSGLHRLQFDAGAVTLTLAFGDARTLLPQLVLGADAIYLDGFAPACNPQLWEPALLRAVGRAARADATLATYTTGAAVQTALAAAGFELQTRPGYGRKRALLTGRYAPRWRVRRREPPTPYGGARHAVVIGAGLAGSACADALARRGWTVAVFDSAADVRGASALPWGLMHPHFAADDNLLARLTRAGVMHAEDALARAASNDRDVFASRADGVFEQVADAAQATQQLAALCRLQWPVDWVEWCEADAAAARLGIAPRGPGLWWARGRLVAPARWAEAMLRTNGIVRQQARVGRIERTGDGWRVLGESGATLAECGVVIVAAAGASPGLLAAHGLPVRAVPGQVTLLASSALEGLRGGLGGDGTLLRAPDGTIAVGATYETSGAAPLLDARVADRSNCERLARLLRDPVEVAVVGRYSGTRCVARDRLPYLGAVADEATALAQVDALRGAHAEDLPRQAGLYSAFAYGSRGLSFAALGAELLAAQIEGEPLPLERALLQAIDPARVLLRRLRSSGAARMPDVDVSRL